MEIEKMIRCNGKWYDVQYTIYRERRTIYRVKDEDGSDELIEIDEDNCDMIKIIKNPNVDFLKNNKK